MKKLQNTFGMPQPLLDHGTLSATKCSGYQIPGKDKGGVINDANCKCYTAKDDGLVLYRMFTQVNNLPVANKAGAISSWVSWQRPTGTKANYMKENAICPEFNDLTHLVTITLKRGQLYCTGLTESIKCAAGNILAQNRNTFQVYVPGFYGKTITDRTVLVSAVVTTTPLTGK
jgi:hypothetical protein